MAHSGAIGEFGGLEAPPWAKAVPTNRPRYNAPTETALSSEVTDAEWAHIAQRSRWHSSPGGGGLEALRAIREVITSVTYIRKHRLVSGAQDTRQKDSPLQKHRWS